LTRSSPELTSRDHAATSTFLHIHRLFQGPSLPPSNAVLPHPVAGEPPLPAHHHRARRGLTTFLFRLPLPPSSPPSIDLGNGLARIRYEVRASVGVAWKDQNRLVTDKCPVDVLQRYPGGIDATGDEGGSFDFDTWPAPEGLIVGEGGKIWVQGRVLGGMLVAGESASVELQVKNHSAKRVRPLIYSTISSFSYTLIIPDRRRASMSRSAVTYIYRRPPIVTSGKIHTRYKSPTLSRVSPSVGPSILPSRTLRVSHNSCLTSRAQPAPSQHICGMVATSTRMKLSPMPSEGGLHHCSRSAAFSRFE
jgi:hypothetical protein